MFDDDANIDCFFFQNTFCCINTKFNQYIFVADLKLHNSVAELFYIPQHCGRLSAPKNTRFLQQ